MPYIMGGSQASAETEKPEPIGVWVRDSHRQEQRDFTTVDP